MFLFLACVALAVMLAVLAAVAQRFEVKDPWWEPRAIVLVRRTAAGEEMPTLGKEMSGSRPCPLNCHPPQSRLDEVRVVVLFPSSYYSPTRRVPIEADASEASG